MFVLLILCMPCGSPGVTQASQQGKLVVRVLLGMNDTPARDAFVYVRGYLPGELSTAVSPIRDGWFEISLQPGLYDVFVGEADVLPMCKRIEIKANDTKVYTARPKMDEEHLQD
jgi:hypothetical protein